MFSFFNHDTGSFNSGQKGIIAGFPHWSAKIPVGIEQEDIIKNYPNHLRGELLLQIATFWTPKEISSTSGVPGLRPNTITKRIKAARAQKASAERKSSVRAKAKKGASHKGSNLAQKQHQAMPPQIFIESEASLKFRVEQQELHDIMEELDPTWACRQLNRSRKKTGFDRELTELAAAERQRRLHSSHDSSLASANPV